MKSYKIPVLSISKFSDKDFSLFSLSSRDYRKLRTKNQNTVKLRDLLENKYKSGKEIGSENYMPKSKHRFLKTVNISKSFILEESTIEYCKPENKIFPKKNEILIVKDGAGDGLGEVCLYPYENKENLDSLSAGVIAINIIQNKRYYVFGILKSQHFKDYVDLNTAQGSTIRHSKLIALDYSVPFPTKNNHPEPQKIESLVSLITQNIINKEEQIKAKNQKIDELIEKELKENQKPQNSFKYSYPKISEIKQETRLDTGIYEREFKETDFLIRNYQGGFFQIKKNVIKTGRTPQDYFFTNTKTQKTSLWLTPKSIKNRQILSLQYLHTKQDTNLSDGDIIFTAIGTGCQGHTLIYDNKTLGKTYINQNACAISLRNSFETNCFISAFINSKLFEIIISKRTSKGSVPAIYSSDIVSLKIPNFPEAKQQEIAKEYYNKIDKNHNLALESYLEKEKSRNSEAGIFQLNMEIFALKEKLEEIIDKIINDLPIEINLNY